MGLRDFFNKLGGGSSLMRESSSPAALSLLDLGSEDIEVAGESYRIESISQVFAAASRPLGGVLMRTAVLVPDPENRYDPYAVGVYVDGALVGWVPAENAPRVEPVAVAYARAGRQLTVPARIWACCEAGHWSARVTLALSGQNEPEWSYVDHASWPGNWSPDGTERLTQTGSLRRIRDAEDAGLVRSRDFEDFRPQIAQAKTDGDFDTALQLTRDCVEAAERRGNVAGLRPTTWPTEQAAMMLRKQKDYTGEIAVVERFLAADPAHCGTQGLRERLAKARALAGQTTEGSAGTPPAERPRFDAPARLVPEPNTEVTLVGLPTAAEVSYEKEYRDAISAVFTESGTSLSSAMETTAIVREIPQAGLHFSPVAVYVGGHLIGFVGALYADTVRALLHQPHLVDKVIGVRCRIYARDKPNWVARATLGPYESVVAGLEDPQSAAEGRANAAMLADLRRQRQTSAGRDAQGQDERLVRGRDFGEWVEHIKQLRRDGDEDAALELLAECVDAAERDAEANGWLPPTWYTEQMAIILRKRGELAGEVAILERFIAACPLGQPQVDIVERLVKARARLAKAT